MLIYPDQNTVRNTNFNIKMTSSSYQRNKDMTSQYQAWDV